MIFPALWPFLLPGLITAEEWHIRYSIIFSEEE